MTPEHYNALMYASHEDQVTFENCREGLPTIAGFKRNGRDKYGEPIPYSIGPHSIRAIREIVKITEPKKILELGFNIGYSASIWLNESNAKVFSVDKSDKLETLAASTILQKRFPSRFEWWLIDTKQLMVSPDTFDLIFIDAAHDEASVTNDIKLGLRAKIKWFVFDDWLEDFGEVQKAFNQFNELQVQKIIGNIALAKNLTII